MKYLVTALILFSLNSFAQKYDKFVGTYNVSDAPFETLILTENNKALNAEAVGQGFAELTETDEPLLFDVLSYGASVKFESDSLGTITGAQLSLEGETFIATKINVVNTTEFIGDYDFADSPLEAVTITEKEGELFASSTSQGDSKLTKTKTNDIYDLEDNMGTATFIRNEAGEITSLKVNAQGYEFVGAKIIEVKSEYIGDYDFSDTPLEAVTLTEKDGELLATSTTQGDSKLTSTEIKDTYDLENGMGTATFIRNETGEITSLKVNAQGYEFIGSKK